MSLVRFDPSFVTVERASIVSQTVGFPVILSFSVLFQSAQPRVRMYAGLCQDFFSNFKNSLSPFWVHWLKHVNHVHNSRLRLQTYRDAWIQNRKKRPGLVNFLEIWASEASLAWTHERAAKPRGVEERSPSLARSRDACFARPNRRACSQAIRAPIYLSPPWGLPLGITIKTAIIAIIPLPSYVPCASFFSLLSLPTTQKGTQKWT